jgi:hypothetical protein
VAIRVAPREQKHSSRPFKLFVRKGRGFFIALSETQFVCKRHSSLPEGPEQLQEDVKWLSF